MKILLIDLLNIGDLLFTTPALKMIRAAYPNSRIDILVHGPFSDVVRNNPNIDNVLTIDKRRSFTSLSSLLDLRRRLNANRYDVSIDLHGSGKSILAAYLSGAKQKIGLSPVRFVYAPTLNARENMHRVDSYIQIVADLGIPGLESSGMEMRSSTEALNSAMQKWQQANISDTGAVVGLNTGARLSDKQWPLQNWVGLADRLGERGITTVLFGGPEDVQAGEFVKNNANYELATFTGQLDLQELSELVAKCSVFVTADTGPMHIASTRKVPIVALFGPTSEAATGPYMTPNIICRSTEKCQACGARGSRAIHTCMSSISVDQVMDAVIRLMN